MSEKTTTLHACTVDETAGGAETTGAVERVQAEYGTHRYIERERGPECTCGHEYGPDPTATDVTRHISRAALADALDDEDTSRSPDEDLAPGSLARHLWATALTDGDGGLTVRDARMLAAAVRVHLVGGVA